MPSPPAAKRRRVDSLGIHKPFVSPLKRNPTATTDQATTTTTSKPSIRATEIIQAQHHLRALESQVRSLRSQNSVLQQALDIPVPHSSSQQTPRLVRLEQKWRKASQQAAEEVFSSFSQNIKDNGGYTAFLKQQQSNQARNFFDDGEQEVGDEENEEEWRDEDGDCLTQRGKRQRREEIDAKKQGKEVEAEEEEEEEEEELTLGSMLHVLNIPFEDIGWDAETQAWK
ncbi:uncharacterized protein M437DRAFT_57274 [Aureobasidium melanogenum CBS 110374]|uniref:Uncharacterized protein n=1 Tax=Aureobasidium melanogenum (strain CBS 110374) TaxID=1043003 RepID=A0A074W9U1_AURM1|nr:uncharacterized protein M437DRAFT_57274 [Aureobasidium melanogenum CBS 110374]KEQ59301.1 hypothetical protein M437DRAFT_57274 [Aureobasidium melanogenum CBS 110374]